MRERILVTFLICISNFLYAQVAEDTTYDPVVSVSDLQTNMPVSGIDYSSNDKIISRFLDHYEEGEFRNSRSLDFCDKLARKIDTIMNQNARVISIQIQGYADGLVNPGLDFSKEQICIECIKYVDISKKIYDEKLAILRACEIEGMLRNLLSSKAYFINIHLKNLRPVDIKDGGPSGYPYRKVEVHVTYTKSKH